MVNPGAFQGLRKQFLMNEKPAYRAGVLGGYAADALANIQRRYFRRFLIDLPHDQEPTVEWLAAVNDNSPDTEMEITGTDKLTAVEFDEAVAQLKERRRVVDYRKAQIKRWLAYQYTKDSDLDPKESGAENPFRILLLRLTGLEGNAKPRLRTTVNIWRKTQRKEIEDEVKRLPGKIRRQQLAAVREQVAKKMFSELSEVERKGWEEQALEDHAERLATWTALMEGEISKDNADRQRCIQNVPQVAQAFLDMLCEATGWKGVLTVGGPEPAHGGQLNMISVHSGVTAGDIKLTFGCSERVRYKEHFVPMFGAFLKKCYTPDECRARALPTEDGFETLQQLYSENRGMNIDSLIPDGSSSTATIPTAATSLSFNPSTMENDVTVSQPPASPARAPSPPASPGRAPSPPASPPRAPSPPASPARAPSPPASPPRAPSPPASPARAPSPLVSPPCAPLPPASPTRALLLPASPPRTLSPPAIPTAPLALINEPCTLPGSGAPGSLSDSPHSLGKRGRDGDSEDPALSKRNRKGARTPTTNTAPPSSPFEPAENAPKWFKAAVRKLRSKDIDPRFLTLVHTWASFEAKEGYKEVAKLDAKHRPTEIGDWIQRGRSEKWNPPKLHVEKYEQQFLMWWYHLQPAWRRENDRDVAWGSINGDLTHMRKPGTNGLLSVIAGLFFWGMNAETGTAHWEKFIICVNDVQAVMSALVWPPAIA